MCRNNGAMNEISFRFLCKIAFGTKNGSYSQSIWPGSRLNRIEVGLFLAHQTFQTRWKFLDRIELFSNSSEETTKTLLAYFHLRQSPPPKKAFIGAFAPAANSQTLFENRCSFHLVFADAFGAKFSFLSFLTFFWRAVGPRETRPWLQVTFALTRLDLFSPWGKAELFAKLYPVWQVELAIRQQKFQRLRQKPSKVFPRTFRSQSPALTSFLYTVLSVGSWTFFRHPRRVGLNWNPKNIYRRRLRRRYFLPHLRPVLISNCEPIRLK